MLQNIIKIVQTLTKLPNRYSSTQFSSKADSLFDGIQSGIEDCVTALVSGKQMKILLVTQTVTDYPGLWVEVSYPFLLVLEEVFL